MTQFRYGTGLFGNASVLPSGLLYSATFNDSLGESITVTLIGTNLPLNTTLYPSTNSTSTSMSSSSTSSATTSSSSAGLVAGAMIALVAGAEMIVTISARKFNSIGIHIGRAARKEQ